MKKLLLGAMMSALFVMNAEAGPISWIKNKAVQVQHKIKNDRSMDEKTEIQPFKARLKNILTTANEFYKILGSEEKDTFKPSLDNMGKFVIFARTAYNKKVTTYNEEDVKACIAGIKASFVLPVLQNYDGQKQCQDFIMAISNALSFARNLEKKYTDNRVLIRVVDGLIEIEKFVTGEEAREAEARRIAAQKEAERVAKEDYQFRLEEAARLEAEEEARRIAAQKEAERVAKEDYQFRLEEAARLEAEAKAVPEENLGSTDTLVVDESGNQVLPEVSDYNTKIQQFQQEAPEKEQTVQSTTRTTSTPIRRASRRR